MPAPLSRPMRCVDGVPGFAGHDGLAILDVACAQVHVEIEVVELDDDPGGVAVRMGAAGFATYRLSGNSRPLELFAYVSRELELADVECG